MKLRNIFESQDDITQQVTNLFDVQGDVDVTDDIVNVKGNILSKDNKKIHSLPFNLGVVTGILDIIGTGLKTCQGFPTRAETVSISYNDTLTSLAGCEKLECEKFIADNTGVKNLENCPLAVDYDFDETAITSLNGLRTERLNKLDARNNGLVDIKTILVNQNRDVSKSRIRLNYNRNLPLVYLTVTAGQDGFFNIELEDLDSTVERTITPYRGKGLGAAIELAIKLRDQGFAGNAKLR